VFAQAMDTYLAQPTDENLQNLREMLELRALAQTAETDGDDAARRARDVKASPLYSDPGVKQSSNWFARLIQRLRHLGTPDLPAPPNLNVRPGLGDWIITAMKILLACLAALFVFLAARHFRWKGRLRRQATAMLDEDEPERTPDEWLERAEALAREGRHREAVRCLYLACLLRFDEHGVARFQRHETNWEHLRRIEASPTMPETLAFREPTRAFDRIWYGHHVQGAEDYERFRAWYSGVMESLRGKAA